MPVFKWIKRIFVRKPKSVFVFGDRSKSAHSYIVVGQDGSRHETLAGTVAYGKGCKPAGGHKPIAAIEDI